MSTVDYKTIVKKAKEVKVTVEKEYKLPHSTWTYYICKAILQPKTKVTKVEVNLAKTSTGDHFSRQIYKSTYMDMAKRLVAFVEKNHALPNNIKDNHNKLMKVRDYVYMFARILVYYDDHGQLPAYANVNSKAFNKPSENTNNVYEYFVKKFGKVTCIDDILEKIAGRGYGYYYDDHKSNIQTIDAIVSDDDEDDPNCTDATQMVKNVADGTGKYKSVDCVHVKCLGGDGHVFLKITQKDGGVFYRDPAAVLDSGVVTKIWCSNGTVLSINPSWWVANLYR